MRASVGIDVGGTFTDLFYESSDGTRQVIKVPTTADDPSRGVLDALRQAQIEPRGLDYILHGTTIATNAVIERRGARCALITTRGFRDVLEMGRRDRPHMYGLRGVQRPLISRDQRWEIDERVDHKGRVLTPVSADQVRALGGILAQHDIQCIVISLLHSYVNPSHEQAVREVLQQRGASWEIVLASDVLREYYEFERTSTAVIQGYLQPLVAAYARNLVAKLDEWGYSNQTLVMQSNGGVVPVRMLGERAAHIVRSGPAAGVIAAAQLAEEAGFDRIITGDMGGTSFDVAVVIEGKPGIAELTQLDFRVPLRLPMIDVHTIGAGGGSIAYVDRGGILQVGPRSAGAYPGPICWGRGGTEPTVTDANLVLGRIDPERPLGLAGQRFDLDRAREAMTNLGRALGLDAEQTANAVLSVVNQKMAGRIRLLSIERGHDPREFVMVIFGGAGPLHGAALAREVGIGRMLIPPHPGVLCAMGCAAANVRYDFSRTIARPLLQVGSEELVSVMQSQRLEGEARLSENDAPITRIEVTHSLDMAYLNQIHSLRVPVRPDWSVDQMADAFARRYRDEYGNTLGDIPVVVVNARTTVEGVRPRSTNRRAAELKPTPPVVSRHRSVYFDAWRNVPIYDRASLVPGMSFSGPAIVDQLDTTIVIEPGMSVRVDSQENLLVEGM